MDGLDDALDAVEDRAWPIRPGHAGGYTAAVQFRFLLMRGWSVIAGYNRYQYVLNEAARRSLQVAPELQRNSVRVGLSWTLPLSGPSSGTRVAPPQLP